MKYYSELLDKMFDTAEALTSAENWEKRKRELDAAAAEAAKAATETRATMSRKVETALRDWNLARENAARLMKGAEASYKKAVEDYNKVVDTCNADIEAKQNLLEAALSDFENHFGRYNFNTTTVNKTDKFKKTCTEEKTAKAEATKTTSTDDVPAFCGLVDAFLRGYLG